MADEAKPDEAGPKPDEASPKPGDTAATATPEAEPAGEGARAATEAARKPRPAPPRVPSEDEIGSPDRNTLVALFVIFAVTVASWGAARFACNMHPPESRGAPKLPTERLIMTPKDAAIEFVQRWRSSDFAGALEVSTADLAGEMQREKDACEARAAECAREREASAGRLTTAVLLAQDGFNAETRVTTTLKGTTEVYAVRVHREDAIWKASGKAPESGGAH